MSGAWIELSTTEQLSSAIPYIDVANVHATPRDSHSVKRRNCKVYVYRFPIPLENGSVLLSEMLIENQVISLNDYINPLDSFSMEMAEAFVEIIYPFLTLAHPSAFAFPEKPVRSNQLMDCFDGIPLDESIHFIERIVKLNAAICMCALQIADYLDCHPLSEWLHASIACLLYKQTKKQVVDTFVKPLRLPNTTFIQRILNSSTQESLRVYIEPNLVISVWNGRKWMSGGQYESLEHIVHRAFPMKNPLLFKRDGGKWCIQELTCSVHQFQTSVDRLDPYALEKLVLCHPHGTANPLLTERTRLFLSLSNITQLEMHGWVDASWLPHCTFLVSFSTDQAVSNMNIENENNAYLIPKYDMDSLLVYRTNPSWEAYATFVQLLEKTPVLKMMLQETFTYLF